ncbi:hypothetical protein ACLKA7_005009 [Drosophila subpalustris]
MSGGSVSVSADARRSADNSPFGRVQERPRRTARPIPATLEDAPGDEKRIRPKSHPGGLHNAAQIRSPSQIRGQKTEPTEILSGKPDQVRPAGTSMRPPPRARRPRCGPKSDPGRTKRKLPMPVALSSSYLRGPLVRIWAQSRPVPATLGYAPRNEKRIRPRSHSRDDSTSPERTKIPSTNPGQVFPGLIPGPAGGSDPVPFS